MSLASALEDAAAALPDLGESIRPANGDPEKLLAQLGAEGAGRTLGWLLEHQVEAGAELAMAFTEVPGGVDPLLGVPEAGLPKAGRKALRRALHRLRSRGAELPRTEEAPVVARLPQVVDELGGAYVSELDPSGARMLVLLEPHPSEGARIFEIVVDEERGVLDFQVLRAGRSRARSFVRDLQRSGRFAVVEAPRHAVEVLLARAAEQRSGEGRAARELDAWRSRIARPPAGAKAPGELVREELSGESTREELERAVALVEARELGPWPPAAEGLSALAQTLQEASKGRVIVSGTAERDRIEVALEACVEQAFPAERVSATVWRFREVAYVHWRRGGQEEARAALAAARAFEEGSLADNPVAKVMVRVALAPALEALGSAEGDDRSVEPASSLIVEP